MKTTKKINKTNIKRPTLPSDSELDDIFKQATIFFIEQDCNKQLLKRFKGMELDYIFEEIINDLELCRGLCLFALGSIAMFVYHPDKMEVFDPACGSGRFHIS